MAFNPNQTLSIDTTTAKTYSMHIEQDYHTNQQLADRFLVDTIEESLESIEKCIELNKYLKNLQ